MIIVVKWEEVKRGEDVNILPIRERGEKQLINGRKVEGKERMGCK